LSRNLGPKPTNQPTNKKGTGQNISRCPAKRRAANDACCKKTGL